MTLLRLLDETAVLVATGVWMDLHAMPLAFALVLAVAALGAAVLLTACVASRRVGVTPAPVIAGRRPRGHRERRAVLHAVDAPVGARGPRAPGFRMPRPTLSH